MKQRRVPKWRQPEVGQAHPIESLILTCKAPSTLSALQRLVPRLSSNSTIVLLQNGMGVYEQLVERLFPDPEKRPHFVLASTSHGVWARGPLNVVHAGLGDFSFGIVPDPQKRRDYEASLKSGFSHLQLADISTNPAEDPQSRTLHATIHALLSLKDLNPHWESMPNMHLKLLRKLCVNCCVNPLTAIMNVTNGELLGSTEAYSILRAICKEASAVFRAHSESGDSYLPATLAMAHLTSPKLEEETMRVIGHTSRNFSSMQQDIKNGKIPTEIEYMNGYLCRLGQQYDVPTPANNMMRQMVKFKSSVGKPTPLPPVMKYWHPLGSFDLGQRERQQTTTKDSTQFRRGSVL
ncbi:hypothetical protein DACRYDRAFT_23507 [Dacryopinax primogenitus]|uniref:2-dehydropantoate 2-reductase n=1 Tax=Dacryopinax primogenitus (strain DJM 731) TaxID=1858805 RepID=M5FRV8_DACPD|nr:uncharacterized protein DACRYDRAFT_23507 [Dacryopinax primogenitus]EJT99975.1 hypothetical protein DACRYDRAFT_23507 [Dacryopinax primogenitus]